MLKKSVFLFLILLILISNLIYALPSEINSIDAVATFNNIGIEVEFNDDVSIELDVFYKIADSNDDYKQGHYLSQIADDKFAGSIFMLESNTKYSIRIQSLGLDPYIFDVTTREDLFVEGSGDVFHVSPILGNDDNDGLSEADSFATLEKALSLINQGDKILLYDGRYLEGDLEIMQSGTQTEPIVIKNAPGENPVLDGTDPEFETNWELYSPGIYRTQTSRQPQKAFLDGGQLYHYANLNDLISNKWGQPGGYHPDGSYIYIMFPNGGTPEGHTFTIPRYTNGFTINQKSHIHIKGLEFAYYGYGTYHQAIYIDGGDYNLIDNCYFHHVMKGVSFKRAADFNVVQNCRFNESPIITWDWTAIKQGGIGYESGGVSVYESNQRNEGNVIRYNEFLGLFDASGIGSMNEEGPTTNFDYHDNKIIYCNDDGLEVDGANINTRVYNNLFDGCLAGISAAPNAIGPTYFIRNTIVNWHPVEPYNGYPVKLNVGSDLSTNWVYLYHNTCYTDIGEQPGFFFKQYSKWNNVISRNNIYAGTEYAIKSRSVPNPIDFDYDNLYTSHSSYFANWLDIDYETLEDLSDATNQETNGFSFEPNFVGAVNGDYRLSSNSDLIDKGIIINGINNDHNGIAPDIGAYEYDSAYIPPVCGDEFCNGYETCESCPIDCDICNSIYHDADTNEDGKVTITELIVYIELWKTGEKGDSQMDDAISEWMK
jgi:hypothetical protein